MGYDPLNEKKGHVMLLCIWSSDEWNNKQVGNKRLEITGGHGQLIFDSTSWMKLPICDSWI